MSFDEFLEFHRNTLLGYFLLQALFPDKLSIETPYPSSVLSEEELEQLMDRFRACMPYNSMMLDLWDWDIHFEVDLGDDWLYEAVFGDEASLGASAGNASPSTVPKDALRQARRLPISSIVSLMIQLH